MLKAIFFLFPCFSILGIYDYSFKDKNGVDVQLSQFEGKKILLVNTASTSIYTSQYGSLEELRQLYGDSLIIIALPSNSFGHDTADNSSIQEFVHNSFHINYFLGSKIEVTGPDTNDIYLWLTSSERNGVLNNPVKNDFYKFLIDKSGNLVGVFESGVDPMSLELRSAIENN